MHDGFVLSPQISRLQEAMHVTGIYYRELHTACSKLNAPHTRRCAAACARCLVCLNFHAHKLVAVHLSLFSGLNKQRERCCIERLRRYHINKVIAPPLG